MITHPESALVIPELTEAQIREMVAAISDNVIAVGVSADEYMEKYAAEFCEWVNGVVIKMPSNEIHDGLFRYLLALIGAYLEMRPIGKLRQAAFVMRINKQSPRREPDLQVILNEHLQRLKTTFVDGPADLCIEIVSPESVERDHGDKFKEYQAGGVTEYWVIDPIHKEARFFYLNAQGIYELQPIDAEGNYRSQILTGLIVHAPTLWNEKLPGPITVAHAIEAMLQE